MSADVGGLRMLARELGEHEQFQVHAHVLNNAANEIWVMQKKLEQHQQMTEKTMHAIVLEREENDRLRDELERIQPTDCEGNAIDIADTVHMLRSEYDGDHEWDDVVVELVLTKWGGDRWIVRGSKGEAWACDCTKTGHDEDMFEKSDDVEPLDSPTLIEVENARLRELVHALLQCHVEDADTCAKCECRSPLHGGCMADVKADELGVQL